MLTTTIATSRRSLARAFDRAATGRARRQPSLILGTLFAIALIACSPPRSPIEVVFDVRFDGSPLGCSAEQRPSLTDLRFYVHDLRLSAAQASHRLALADDGGWQDGEVALIDLEDGSGTCRNGSPATNRSVRASARLPAHASKYQLEFSIGIPEELNHANPMLAPAPRNLSSMHWHWRSGYKFMRVGIETDNDVSWLHLGSARCSGTISNIEGCAAANRPVVRLSDFDPNTDVVVIDVARLLGPTGLGDGETWSCESGATEAQCALAFAELGLNPSTGERLGPAPAFFKARRR